MKKIVRNTIIGITIFLLVINCFLIFATVGLADKNKELNNKVQFYEKVVTDLGLDELVNYPNAYYNEEYIPQEIEQYETRIQNIQTELTECMINCKCPLQN